MAKRKVRIMEDVSLLSESFERKDIEPALECRVRMINIRYGHNRELMHKCSRLEQYARFIALLEYYRKEERNVINAVEKAVNQGIEEGLLPDILTRQKAEVYSMLLTEYNEKKHMRQTYEEGVREGRKEGIREGIREGTELGAEQKLEELVRKKLARGKSMEEMADELEETEESIQRIIERLK